MADIPPPNNLYPAPQAPSAANMLANPALAVGILNGLQDFRLKQQQFDALAERPSVDLQTAKIIQQEASSKAVHRIMGGYLAGIKNPTDDDVRSAAALAARSLPEV